MIRVTCAVIEKEGKVLCAQRSTMMDLPLKWELPGGKVEKGESLEDCLIREIQEELEVKVSPFEELPHNRHIYNPQKSIELIPFRCRIIEGDPVVREHKQLLWVAKSALGELDWAEADIPIINNYMNKIL